MNKRGLSNIIVTLILIAISLIAVGLIWVTVQNLIESETEQISLGFITVDLEIKDVKVESDGSVKISVGRKIGEGDITGLKFIVSDGINTETIDKENVDLDQLEEKTFTLTSGEFGEVVFIKEISVAPVFTLESGKEKIGSVVDNEVLTKKQIIENIGAISWWKLDGNAKDEIGDNDGTLNGGVSFVDGKFGKAGSFEGGSYIDIPNPSLDLNNYVTVSLWQYGDVAIQPQADYIFEGRDTNGFRVLNLHLPWSDSKIYWDAGNSGEGGFDRISKLASESEFEGQWNYWTVLKNAVTGEMKMYLNGELWHEGTGKTRTMSIITKFKIGSHTNGGTNYDGQIDEVMIFNKALTDKQVEALYNLDLS